MIVTFGDRDTESIWLGNRVKSFGTDIQEVARRKLRILNNAASLQDLQVPPGNRLEKLSGDKQEFYSIRVNNQWRIIFRWETGFASDVTLTDYH